MYRNQSHQLSPFQQAEDTHKDNIIATLKKELCDLRDLQTDFLRLNEEISRLESKYSLLQQQKDRNQKEHKLKMQINKKVIIDMRDDLDALKSQIHKTSTQIEETVRENSTLKRMCDNRNEEITSLMSNNRELEKRNDAQVEQNRNITFNIKQLKQEKVKLETECERLHGVLDGSMQALKNAEKQIRILQNTNNKLDNALTLAEQDNMKLLEEMKTREISMMKTQKGLNDLIARTETVKQKNRQLESQSIKLEGDCQGANSLLNIQINRNRDLTLKVKNLDNTIRATQSQLQESISKKQNLKKDHFELVAENRSFNADIDSCLVEILEFQKLNLELQRQIENYMETDEQARSLLNRKDVMKSLLQQVTTRLEKTGDQIAHLR